MSIKLMIHGTGIGQCCLSGKEGEGITVTFDDGTVTNAFLSWKAFQQLLGMKSAQKKPEATKPPQATAVPVNAQAVKP